MEKNVDHNASSMIEHGIIVAEIRKWCAHAPLQGPLQKMEAKKLRADPQRVAFVLVCLKGTMTLGKVMCFCFCYRLGDVKTANTA